MGRASALFVLVAFVATACSGGPPGPTAPQFPGVSFPTPDVPGEPPDGSAPPASPATEGGGTTAALPSDIVGAVDSLLNASTDAERVEAATAMLASAGVTVSAEADAAATTQAGIVLAPEEVEVMAVEAANRELYRATLAEFAETFGGMALLPPNDALGADLPDDWLEGAPEEGEVGTEVRAELQLTELPPRIASVVHSWVTSSIESHASGDPDLVQLTNAPLLLAELARRRAEPVDLVQPFSAGDVRLGWLEITILTAGIRSMLAGVEAADIATAPAAVGSSVVLATRRDHPLAPPAPLAQQAPCDALKQMLDSRVPLASTVIGSFVGDQIKGFIQNFVNAMFGEASVTAQNVSRGFKILSVIFKVQALVMIYSEATVKVEMDPDFYHRPDGARERRGAVVTAGIPDPAWEAAKQARQLSPFATAMRTCARFLGLPVWQDLVDVGGAVDDWKVQWELSRGGQHVEIPARDQFASGRFERPLTAENDHRAIDAIDYDALPERREEHPGEEHSDIVEFCGHVYPKAPPSGFGTILSAGTAGASLAGGGYLGLAAVIANLLTSWVSTIAPITGCGQATVSYHVATPGSWHGTVAANTEIQDSSSSTVNEHLGAPWGTTVHTHSSRTSVDVTDRFYLGGTDDEAGMGFVSLNGRQYTNGAATDETHSTSTNRWSPSGCNYNLTEDAVSGGGWHYDTEATGSISLYSDGHYTISFYSRAPEEQLSVPGEHVKVVSPLNDCEDIGSGTDDWPYFPSATGTSATSMVEGQLDPQNPGNVLRGQTTITNYDLSTTTITWNIVHDGPIRLPGF